MIFLQAYLLVGCMMALFILWTTLANDFDQFCRDYFRQEPPSTLDKWVTAVASIVVWPVHLYWMLSK